MEKTMNAAVYYANDDVRVEQRPIPSAPPGGLLIKTACCGVCVADTMQWYNKPKAPIVLGHEATGIVAATGGEVPGFSVGDRVFVHHHVPCMTCDSCRRGNYTVCETFKSTRYDPGGFCEYFAVGARHAAEDTLLLPDSVGYDDGTLIEPLACVVHAVQRMNFSPGDRVVIIGAGTIGLMFLETLRAYGLRDITVCERIPWRAQQAKKRGAAVTDDALGWRAQTGGADRVLVIAKDVAAIELGLGLAAAGGEVLLFATPGAGELIPFDANDAFFKELRVVLSYSADHNDTREALRLIEHGLVDASGFITHRYPVSGLADAIAQTIGRGECLKCIMEIDSDPQL